MLRGILAGGLVGALALAAPFHAAAAPTAATGADQRIAQQVRLLWSDPALGDRTGLSIVDVASGASTLKIRSAAGLMPASTMKLVTAFTSLTLMGAQHRFQTRVRVLDSGRRLVLEGGGDPVLSRADLQSLALKTQQALRRQGDPASVVVDFDDDLFGPPGNAPGWEGADMPTYVSAVTGLTMLGVYSRDTASVTAQAFVDALRSTGLRVTRGSRTDVSAQAPVLARFQGNDLAEAVRTMIGPSENNIAEILFRHVAIAAQQPPTWSGAAAATRVTLRTAGVTLRGVRIVDGSGLSYANRLTPRMLTAVLAAIATDPDLAVARQSLPIAGQSGTLLRRFAAWPASCARGAVAAKTGSLPMTVSTLAGLTIGADGRVKAFAILVNDRPSSFAWAQTSAAIDTVAAAIHGCVP